MNGFPQDSSLGLLMFKVFINDHIMFVEMNEGCNFANDNTMRKCSLNLFTVILRQEHHLSIMFNWLKVNLLKANIF